MKKVWEVIKKFFIWLGVIFCGVLTVLFMGKKTEKNSSSAMVPSDDWEEDEIEKVAECKREEVSNRIRNTTAADLTKGYPTVRRTINSGIDRFRKRCSGNKSGTDS